MDNRQCTITAFKYIIFIGTLNIALALDWSYKGEKGPSKWKNLPGNAACGGKKQSPINIDSSEVKYQESLGTFSFTGYNSNPGGMNLVNNGHTAQVNLQGNIKVSGGGLKGDYKTAQFHFHWGSTNTQGSEHTINSIKYPMEVHLVHYSTQYSSLGGAVDQPNGLAVLGFMFEISDKDNPALNTLISGLSDVQHKGDEANLDPFPLDSFLPSNKDDYYRYEGSLTTPKCQETVIWTIFTNKIKISQKQIEAFRKLNMNEQGSSQHAGKIVDNFRPVQGLNGRKIYSSMESSSVPQLKPSFLLASCIISVLVSIFKY